MFLDFLLATIPIPSATSVNGLYRNNKPKTQLYCERYLKVRRYTILANGHRTFKANGHRMFNASAPEGSLMLSKIVSHWYLDGDRN